MRSTLNRLRDRVGVRAASALAAAVAVAVVLVVAGFSLVLLLQKALTGSVAEATESQARVLGDRIVANFSGTGDPKRNAIDATGKRSDIVQALTSYGDETNAPDWLVGSNGPNTDVQVLGSSDVLDAQPRLVPWLVAPGETRTDYHVDIELVDGEVRDTVVVGIGFRANGRPITVLAAQELAPVASAVDTVKWLLVGGIPILVLVSGYFTYLFAGGALRPVERMRSRVAAMDERDLSRRVPEPASHDEIGRLARTMNQMLGRIDSAQATQRRFVADASHELRSPLATVSTGLELLEAGTGENSADRATVQTLRGETARLTGLVEGLLFLARADERGLVPRREEVDLDEIVEAERVRPSADGAVAVRVDAEPVRVVGDRGQLVRVVRNLVDNARRHAAGTVEVTVRTDGSDDDRVAVIDVDDDGNGVPETDRARVFERFVRLDEARARGDGGSGLGLSIVSELIAAHGGTVSVLDAPELGGARFRVTVPIAGVAAPDPDDDAAVAADPPAAGTAGSARRPAADDPVPAEPERDPWTGQPVEPAAGQPAPDRDRPVTGDTVSPVHGTRPARAPERRATPRSGMMPTPRESGAGHVDRSGQPWGGDRTGDARPGDDPRPGTVGTASTGSSSPPAPEAPVPDPQDRRRPDAPTGPVPIRPTTVGSPYDENATGPIPVQHATPGTPRPEAPARGDGHPVGSRSPRARR